MSGGSCRAERERYRPGAIKPAGWPRRGTGSDRALLVAANTGGASLLLVGAAGLGKTALLDAAAGVAEEAGCRVVSASGMEFEAELPFAGLHQLLQGLLPTLVVLPDGVRDALLVALGLKQGEITPAAGLGTAGLALLDQASRERPLALLIDDVHWIDRSSAVILSFAARRLSSTAVRDGSPPEAGTSDWFWVARGWVNPATTARACAGLPSRPADDAL